MKPLTNLAELADKITQQPSNALLLIGQPRNQRTISAALDAAKSEITEARKIAQKISNKIKTIAPIMQLITKAHALAKLAANPEQAAAFDAVNPGKSRSEVLDTLLPQLNSKRNQSALKLAKLKQESVALKSELNRRKASKPKTTAAKVGKFVDASYSLLVQAAIHRSSNPEDKAEAKAQLESLHGVTVSKEGIVSHSMRGGRAAKQSQKSN